MPTFHYANPETIHWGAGCLREKLDSELRRIGGGRVFIVTTRSAVREPALAPAIESMLGDRFAGRFADIGQHAPARSVMDAVRAVRESRADALLSVGGGSPIDAAKTVAFSIATGLDVTLPDAPARARGAKLDGVLPHLAVPTTLSVAELAGSAGFSAEGTKEKVGVAAPQLRPAAVFYDATLAVKTPLDLWLSTGIRAVDHAVETYCNQRAHPATEALSLQGLRLLARALPAIKRAPGDLAPRLEAQFGMWQAIAPAASGIPTGASHGIGYALGATFGVAHGHTSCVMLHAVLKWNAAVNAERQKALSEARGQPGRPASDLVRELVVGLDQPVTLRSVGIKRENIDELARRALSYQPVQLNPRPIKTAGDVKEILELAW